jgi:isocitrate/isopropylmalate dehydrogenase
MKVAVIVDGRVRTYDMGGTNTTLEMADAIASALPESVMAIE